MTRKATVFDQVDALVQGRLRQQAILDDCVWKMY